MVASLTTISYDSDYLSYNRACDLADQALVIDGAGPIHIGLHGVARTTTAALARLVSLRCSFRRSGRDLMITGLHGQAKDLYEFNQMSGLLPRN